MSEQPVRVGAKTQQIERPRQPHASDERNQDQRQRTDDGLIAGDVEVAHEPAQRAKRLGEIAQVLHEQNQRREERVQRDAGEQQDRCRHRARTHRREQVDDPRGDG